MIVQFVRAIHSARWNLESPVFSIPTGRPMQAASPARFATLMRFRSRQGRSIELRIDGITRCSCGPSHRLRGHKPRLSAPMRILPTAL